MPHIIVEYSANLGSKVDIARLVATIHEAALATQAFPPGGTRTRAARRDIYAIADTHPDNAFIHVQLSVGEGRSVETRHRAGAEIFATLVAATADISDRHPLALSLNIAEIDKATSFKKNNIHDYFDARREDAE